MSEQTKQRTTLLGQEPAEHTDSPQDGSPGLNGAECVTWGREPIVSDGEAVTVKEAR